MSSSDGKTATYQAVEFVVGGEERLFGFRLQTTITDHRSVTSHTPKKSANNILNKRLNDASNGTELNNYSVPFNSVEAM